jgi:hypothetical protein
MIHRSSKTGAVQLKAVTDSLLGGTYEVYGQEANQDLQVKTITVSGTVQVGQTLTISFTVENNSGRPLGTSIVRVYRAADQRGTSKTLASTLMTSTLSTTYPLTLSDLSKYLTFEITPVLEATYSPNGFVKATPYGQIVAGIPSVFDVFDKWRFEFTSGSLQNQGNSGDAVMGTNAPVWDSVNNRYNFTRASSQNMLIPKSGTWTETFEIWLKVQMKSTSSTQNIIALASACYIRINSGNIQINGTNVTAANTNLNTIRVVFNGVSSKIQINNGVETTFSSGASGGGSGNAFLASSTTGSNFGDLYLHKLYGKENGVLTNPERDAVWAELGY